MFVVEKVGNDKKFLFLINPKVLKYLIRILCVCAVKACPCNMILFCKIVYGHKRRQNDIMNV